MTKKLKISFCTVSMNRLHHLEKTLPKNIKDNLSYSNLEFVVLNYGSKDGLDDWMNHQMLEYRKKGIIQYYITNEPSFFLRSHSKNVAAKQATGDIICNVDADNFIGEGFAEYVNEIFTGRKDCYMTVDRLNSAPDFYGRICLRKKDFWAINGYDESMVGYGFEDYDMWNRLEIIGKNAVYIDDPKYLKSLKHNDEERIENESNRKDIFKIYIRYLNHATSQILYLFNDGNFYLGHVIINKLYYSESIENLFINKDNFKYYNSLLNNLWDKGKWVIARSEIILEDQKRGKIKFAIEDKVNLERIIQSPSEERFIEILSKSQLSELIMFFSQISNRIIMERNRKNKITRVNNKGFGISTLI